MRLTNRQKQILQLMSDLHNGGVAHFFGKTRGFSYSRNRHGNLYIKGYKMRASTLAMERRGLIETRETWESPGYTYQITDTGRASVARLRRNWRDLPRGRNVAMREGLFAGRHG